MQDPTNTQSYNRYSYCGGNPLKYTDPTGYDAYGGSYTSNYGGDFNYGGIEGSYNFSSYSSYNYSTIYTADNVTTSFMDFTSSSLDVSYGDQSYNMSYGSGFSGTISYPNYDYQAKNYAAEAEVLSNGGSDWLKQYVAIVVGESGNSHDEAQGIGEVIQRRMDYKGVEFGDGFIDKIGGKGQYDAIGGKIYNSIMNSSWDDILSSDNPYNERVMGAIHAYISPEDNISKGAYFWNASSPETGFNWNSYNSGVFKITTTLGGTTFFKYSNPNKFWP